MKKGLRRLVLFSVCFLILISITKGDTIRVFSGPEIEWEKTFDRGSTDDKGYSVQQTTDGGYVIVGNTFSTGSAGDVCLIKTNAAGEEQWESIFGGKYNDYGYSVQQTTDGGYIIVGETQSFGGATDVYLIKTNAAGTEVWEKTLGGTKWDCGNSVQQTKDGGYIIAGSTYSFGTGDNYSDVYLIKTNTSGDVVWEKTFGGTGQDCGNSVQQTTDGGYVITGDSNGQAYLIKTDADGGKLWEKTFGIPGAYYNVRYLGQQTKDGGYIIAGYNQDEVHEVYLIKTNSGGEKQWEKTFGGTGNDKVYSVQQTTDGGYIIVGETCSFNDRSYGDVYVIKTDAAGEKQWEKTFAKGNNHDWGNSVQQTTDGGYIIAGGTYVDSEKKNDVWLIKLPGEKGDISGDGKIDISDVILCLRMAIALDTPDISLADMNNDTKVDITDVILILRKAIGLD